MLRNNTPIEYYPDYGIWVKREDLSCDGPRFSKTRGVLAHIANRPEKHIGVLDTAHSQGGWAVARACAELGKQCTLWYPVRKREWNVELPPPRQQVEAQNLGAKLYKLPAGRSAILYHQAKKDLAELTKVEDGSLGYMMPNALKLSESVTETAEELIRSHDQHDFHRFSNVLVSCSSGTIAAGVAKGLDAIGWAGNLCLHLGYSRSADAVFRYIEKMSGVDLHGKVWGVLVDEGYSYKDTAPEGTNAPFSCNPYYDLKLWSWWVRIGRFPIDLNSETLFWLIG